MTTLKQVSLTVRSFQPAQNSLDWTNRTSPLADGRVRMSGDAGVGHSGRVLMVCTGNVCRSPFMERRLAQLLPGSSIEVTSAGTAALVGEPIDPGSVAQLASRNCDGSDFTARQLIPEMARAADLVLTAGREHRATVVQLHPKALRYCFTLGDFADLLDGLDVEQVGPDWPGQTQVARIAAAAAARRGLVPPRPAAQSDILDPVHQGPAQFARMAQLIDRALTPVVQALSQPSEHRA